MAGIRQIRTASLTEDQASDLWWGTVFKQGEARADPLPVLLANYMPRDGAADLGWRVKSEARIPEGLSVEWEGPTYMLNPLGLCARFFGSSRLGGLPDNQLLHMWTGGFELDGTEIGKTFRTQIKRDFNYSPISDTERFGQRHAFGTTSSHTIFPAKAEDGEACVDPGALMHQPNSNIDALVRFLGLVAGNPVEGYLRDVQAFVAKRFEDNHLAELSPSFADARITVVAKKGDGYTVFQVTGDLPPILSFGPLSFKPDGDVSSPYAVELRVPVPRRDGTFPSLELESIVLPAIPGHFQVANNLFQTRGMAAHAATEIAHYVARLLGTTYFDKAGFSLEIAKGREFMGYARRALTTGDKPEGGWISIGIPRQSPSSE